ncbi:hypothetical protein SARC_12942, partial [Sphaeroforma arctica JP610]
MNTNHGHVVQHPFIVKEDMLHRNGDKKTLNTLIDNTPTHAHTTQHPFIVKKDMLHRKGGKKTLNTLIDNTFVRMAERQEQGLASGSDTGTFSASTMVAAQ